MAKSVPQSKFTLGGLKSHARQNKTHDWVHEFLTTVGKNKGMAQGLKRDYEEQSAFWVGPLLFPLSKLTRCTGPENDLEYPQAPKRWERRVTDMVNAIKTGWEPPVIIANPRPWPILSVRDGNHRYEALRRCGKRKYWTLFWFETKAEERKFLKSLEKDEKAKAG